MEMCIGAFEICVSVHVFFPLYLEHVFMRADTAQLLMPSFGTGQMAAVIL